jgi:hypothetical protein
MTVLGTFDHLVHLVIVKESKYEYGLTACGWDFMQHDDREQFIERDVMPTRPTTAPYTCFHCAIAPPPQRNDA